MKKQRTVYMNYCILLAGGRGARTGADLPKQYIRAGAHMMITYAIAPLIQSGYVDGICIVLEQDMAEKVITDIADAGLDTRKVKFFAEPGENRQFSIMNGMAAILRLKRVGSSGDTVLIHDAARPFLKADLLERMYDALPGHDGVMPALPVKETIYYCKEGAAVSALPDRQRLYAGQAPELFYLRRYYEANAIMDTDAMRKVYGSSEPALAAGMNIVIIPGDENNIKITTDADLKKFTDMKR